MSDEVKSLFNREKIRNWSAVKASRKTEAPEGFCTTKSKFLSKK